MSTEPIRRIAVGIDGSEHSRRALAWATVLAKGLGADLIAIHAFQPLDHLEELEPGHDFTALEEDARRRLESDWCSTATAEGVTCLPVVATGAPADVILDKAAEHECGMIVVGARGLGKLRELVLGSVSTKLTHVSTIPVTIVPARSD